MKGYDYSKKGYYLLTIVPNNKKYSFSKIINSHIELNEIGRIIDNSWKWIMNRYDHVQIDEYIIMPDHFHGIVQLLPESEPDGRDRPLQSRKRKPIPEIIGAFKTISSKQIHNAGYVDFKWQRSYHDHIIRSNKLNIKRNYIRTNPVHDKKNYFDV